MEICLVRHGETDWNRIGKLQGHTDIELNAMGIEQANACANYLMQKHYELIYTSPLKRAKQRPLSLTKQHSPSLKCHYL